MQRRQDLADDSSSTIQPVPIDTNYGGTVGVTTPYSGVGGATYSTEQAAYSTGGTYVR